MRRKFTHNLSNLARAGDQFLLAVSGGIDSMVMCDFFLKTNRKFAIAHCNFSLRGEESDGDEKLVAAFAQKHQIPFFGKRFETEKYAEENKIGIQEAARNLRYEWFEKLTQTTDYQLIVTAHHLNDSAETVLLNLTKGTGLSGLHGIPARRENIIRPLLNFSKEELKNYAKKYEIEYREDSSNASVKYQRNLIRNSVIPLLKKVNPSFEKTMEGNIERLSATEEIFSFFIEKIKLEILKKKGDLWKISKLKLQHLPHPETILFEILKPLNFNFKQIKNVFEILEAEPGKVFNSPTHQLLIDRDAIFVKPFSEKEPVHVFLNQNETKQISNSIIEISCEILENKPAEFTKSNNTALLDFSKLTFPLTIENWKPGDKFQPLGMKGKHQKLQDFFSNQKLNRFEKEEILVVKSAGRICWIADFRLSENFKLTETTSKTCILKIYNSKL